MEWLTGTWFAAGDYDVARQVLQRGIAAIYLVALLSSIAQFPALVGENGLLPVRRFVERTRPGVAPSLFRHHYSDRFFLILATVGVLIAAALVLGLPQLGPAWAPMLAFGLLWVLYMSIVNVGQVFYGYGWESLLLEAGFLAAFLGSDVTGAPVTMIFLTRWLVFRLEFGAGMIKIRGDSCWRDLTALYYHHETQPMPNPGSWHFHHLPKPLHRAEVLGNHFAQLVVPFFLFAPQPIASIAAAIIILTQGWLVLSGNFAWLNVLTMILAFAAIDDGAVAAVIPALGPDTTEPETPWWFVVVVLVVSAWLVVLAYRPLRNLVARRQLMNASFNRWHLGNAYGAFGSITRVRHEIVIEGTLASGPDHAEGTWREYQFHGKPSDPGHRPRQFAPYQLRLDWQLWFMALGAPSDPWFRPLLDRLLVADPRTLRLLRLDPFDGTAPRWIRVRLFHYRFSTRAERRATGDWWVRTPLGTLVPPTPAPRRPAGER